MLPKFQPHRAASILILALLGSAFGCSSTTSATQSAPSKPQSKSASPTGKILAGIGLSQAEIVRHVGGQDKLEGGFQTGGDAGAEVGPFGEKGLVWDVWNFEVKDAARGAQFYAYIYQAQTPETLFKLLGEDLKTWQKKPWNHVYEDGKRETDGFLYSKGKLRIGIKVRADKQFTTLEIWRDR